MKERILTIRLMEKTGANPAYAEALGIASVVGTAEYMEQTHSDSAGDKLHVNPEE